METRRFKSLMFTIDFVTIFRSPVQKFIHSPIHRSVVSVEIMSRVSRRVTYNKVITSSYFLFYFGNQKPSLIVCQLSILEQKKNCSRRVN